MNHFEVYAERDLFEQIISDEANYPNWTNIIANHSTSYLDLSEEELNEIKENPGDGLLDAFFNAYGSDCVESGYSFFKDFNENNFTPVSNPFSAYFLNKNDQEITNLTDQFGLLFSNNKINDKYLVRDFSKKLIKDVTQISGHLQGWKAIIKDEKFTFNSILLTDPHIFLNEENSENLGPANIINLLDAIMPQKLNISMDITVITSVINKEGKKRNSAGLSTTKAEQLFNKVKFGLTNIRTYPINLQLVFTPNVIHDRYVFTNYNSFECKSGFKVFSIADKSKVNFDNSFKYYGNFIRHKPENGDSSFNEVISEIKKTIEHITSTLRTLKGTGSNLEYQKCFGFDDTYTIKNRLLNYFP